MNITPDYLVERKIHIRRIRRLKVSVVILAIFVLLAVLSKHTWYDLGPISGKDHIALVDIKGMIKENYYLESRISSLKNDERVKAVIININSSGGTAAGSERLYNAIKWVKKAKPVVATMGTTAASAGYMVALASDYIIAHNCTITGSIGVISQAPDLTELLSNLGIKFNIIKSGEFKSSPNPVETLTDRSKEAIESTVMDIHNYFVDLVVENRKLSREVVSQIASGKVYTGRQAYKLELVDDIGDTQTAIAWLEREKGIKNLTVKRLDMDSWSKYSSIIDAVSERISSLLSARSISLN